MYQAKIAQQNAYPMLLPDTNTSLYICIWNYHFHTSNQRVILYKALVMGLHLGSDYMLRLKLIVQY